MKNDKNMFSHEDHGGHKEKHEYFQEAFPRAFVPLCEKLTSYEIIKFLGLGLLRVLRGEKIFSVIRYWNLFGISNLGFRAQQLCVLKS